MSEKIDEPDNIKIIPDVEYIAAQLHEARLEIITLKKELLLKGQALLKLEAKIVDHENEILRKEFNLKFGQQVKRAVKQSTVA